MRFRAESVTPDPAVVNMSLVAAGRGVVTARQVAESPILLIAGCERRSAQRHADPAAGESQSARSKPTTGSLKWIVIESTGVNRGFGVIAAMLTVGAVPSNVVRGRSLPSRY